MGYGLGEFYIRKPDMCFEFKNAYYGNRIKYNERIQDDVAGYIESICEASTDLFVQDLAKEVLIWIEDRCEIGPRALGHRSILANPQDIRSKDILNKVKGRQWWRPVAPVILEDHVLEWFENGTVSEYMLKTFTAIPEVEERIEAVLHLDKSARVQTVSQKQGFLYDCIHTFYETTGIPIVCNTSLNDKGEPIIDTFYGTLAFAIKKIFVLYMLIINVLPWSETGRRRYLECKEKLAFGSTQTDCPEC